MSLFNKVQNIIFEKNDLQEKRREDGSIIKKFQDSTSRPDYDNLSGKQKEQLQNIINNNNQSSKNDYEKDAKKYRKLKNYQKFKKFTTSAMGKIVGKTRLGTGARVIGAIAAVKGYDMLKNKLRGDTASEKDFTFSGPIVDKSGKEIRYSYGGNKNTNPKFSNFKLPSKYSDRSKTISDKLKSGQFKVKSK